MSTTQRSIILLVAMGLSTLLIIGTAHAREPDRRMQLIARKMMENYRGCRKATWEENGKRMTATVTDCKSLVILVKQKGEQ
jgi:hypothetical protein